MLVLTRKAGEEILIGEKIKIVVIDASPEGIVRIGIEAPSEIKILRAELLEEVKSANKDAIIHSEDDLKNTLSILACAIK